MDLRTIWWENGVVRMVDQTLLPEEYKVIDITTPEAMWEAIKILRVRGAPAIGISAAFGVVLGIKDAEAASAGELIGKIDKVADYLATSRPTAVNLFWALDRIKRVARENEGRGTEGIRKALLDEALEMVEEDDRVCRAIGKHGADLLNAGDVVLTHCNAGGLATASYGTALAVIYSAQEQGKRPKVYADETRPLLQGSRLTAWELHRAGVDVTLICDSMAAHVMRDKGVRAVVVGADRIASNGDTANKIGTYMLSVLAREHGVPFYVAAPISTLDLSIPDGSHIPIEERDPDEIRKGMGKRTAPEDVKVYNPAFDVTPAGNITGIITEKGVARFPYTESLAHLANKA